MAEANVEKFETEADSKQVTKYSTENCVSRFDWELVNFSDFPDALYVTEKVDILNTNFFW